MNKILQFKNIISILILITFSLTLNSCGIYRKTDAREIPTNANDRIEKMLKKVGALKLAMLETVVQVIFNLLHQILMAGFIRKIKFCSFKQC